MSAAALNETPQHDASASSLVVGVVGSAGALGAFQKFFSALPADADMAFVVIPHLDPKRKSMMVPLLAKHSRLTVTEAANGEPVLPGHVYVLPADRYLTIRKNRLRLTGPVDASGPSTSIDLFLRALAEDQREHAVCVILSGTGAHGSLGLKLIKAHDGLAMVQDPETADFDQMPANAIATGLADYVLPVERMPGALVDYARRMAALRPATGTASHQEALLRLVDLLRAHGEFSFDFRFYRKAMMLRRVRRRMTLAKVDDPDDYYHLVERDPEEMRRLARDLLINVTTFFRNPEMYRLLETRVVPDLVSGQTADEDLRVWVPGCATGEEAYSLAIVILEQLAARGKTTGLQVFATDVIPECLDTARRGTYPESIWNDVSAARLARYFTPADHSFRVKKPLRDAVLFTQQNLLADIPFSRLHVVSCRNVLIYLAPEMQERLLQLFHFALNDDGYLVLGPSETVGRRTDLFEPVSRKWRIYRRVRTGRRAQVDFPLVHAGTRFEPRAVAAPRADALAQAAHALLLNLYTPAAVLAARGNQVLHFFGPTERYLRQPAGEPTQDLMLLAPEGLRGPVRTVVSKALGGEPRASVQAGRLKRDGKIVAVRVTARPLRIAGREEPTALVTFEDQGAAQTQQQHKGRKAAAEDTMIRHLQDELSSSRDELQGTIEELARSNEDLKASNEEVRSMNEELQSANEELETSREELQSLNEELSTANNQLQDKVVELETSHNDMANLLRSAEIAAMFLDANLLIKRFTPAVTKLFNLIESDIGRPFGDVTARFEDPALHADIDHVLHTLAPKERDVPAADGGFYLRRIVPYRAEGERIDGVVISFSEVTALKRAEQALRDLATDLEKRVTQRTKALQDEVAERKRVDGALRTEHGLTETVLGTAAALIIVRDAERRVERFNKACEAASGYTFEEVRGKAMLPWLDESDHAASMEVCDRVAREPVSIASENLWHHRDGSERAISWSVSGIYGTAGELEHIVGVGIDITEERNAQKLATQRQQELLHIYRVHTAGGLAAALAHELNQPLAALVAYCETSLAALRAGGTAPDEIAANLEKATAQAHRASAIIRELRGFLIKSAGTRAPVDLHPVAHAVHELLEPQTRAAGIDVRIEVAPDLPRIIAGRIHIEQLLVNLIKNAIEAITGAVRPDGKVTITAVVSPNEMMQISVADNGPGLEAEAIQRMFEPFYTTKSDGLGMGLAISRSIVEAHGGRLWAEPAADGGAIFHFTIPIET